MATLDSIWWLCISFWYFQILMLMIYFFLILPRFCWWWSCISEFLLCQSNPFLSRKVSFFAENFFKSRREKSTFKICADLHTRASPLFSWQNPLFFWEISSLSLICPFLIFHILMIKCTFICCWCWSCTFLRILALLQSHSNALLFIGVWSCKCQKMNEWRRNISS